MNFGYEIDSDKSEKLMLSALFGPISPFDRNTHFLEKQHVNLNINFILTIASYSVPYTV